jgi:putative ABC transport system permease protein
MIRHTLLLIYRSFKRFKSTFVINLIGLSTGLASVLLIYLWVNDELSVDKFHAKDSRLYQVMERWDSKDGIKTVYETAGPTVVALDEEIPGIEYIAAVAPPTWPGFDGLVLSVGEQNIKATGQYVGKDYFNVFSYGLIAGNADQVLADKSSIVVSAELAKKLFNTTEGVVGKAVAFQHEKEFLISGVFDKIPSTSSVQFDFALSFDAYLDIAPWYSNWGNTGPLAYVILKEGVDVNQVNSKIADLIQRKTNGDIKFRKLFLTPYSDTYLYGKYENGVQSGGRIEYVRLFSIIAVFILFIACINFMNLSTAKAAGRLKEVGVKKALGAGRKRLAIQYISESTVMAMVSLIVAIALVSLVLPGFNLITGKQLALVFDIRLVMSMIIIILFTGLVAGSYPALYLTGFSPVAVLKGKLSTSMGELWTRKGLVAFQFTLSIILIVSVMVVYRQIEFVQSTNLGYDKDNVIYFDVEGRVRENPETFLSEIKRIPGIQSAASTTHDMVGHNWAGGLNWEGKDPNRLVLFQIMGVSYDFIETLDIEMKEGRFFSRDFGADTTKIIFNEAAIKIMGYENPICRKVNDMEIIGVVKDFHFESFHEEVQPQFFILHRKQFAAPTLIMARIKAGKETETVERLNKFYQAYNPGFPLDYTFLDEDYQAQYIAEQRVSTLSRYFAGLAILISCLGLFGLAAFTAQRRLKEIGIRKILGSSDFGIVRLLSSDFTKTILIAIIIAMPVSYFITRKWLDGFVYRIDLEWWFFAGSAFLALLIAWVTIGLQTFKAARINPTECLKQE